LRNYGASYKYYHTDPGTNSRLDTLQAAVLLEKLPHLPEWNRERNLIAQLYDSELAPLQEKGIVHMQNQSGEGHVYHLYVVKITEACPISRQELQQKLIKVGIQTGIHYPIPCHLQPAFSNLGYQLGDFPHAEALSKQILSLPMYPGLTPSQVKEVVAAIAKSVCEQKLLMFNT
jgi:dTDP-4-amino-4,6-dideoxygalactose transaminase